MKNREEMTIDEKRRELLREYKTYTEKVDLNIKREYYKNDPILGIINQVLSKIT